MWKKETETISQQQPLRKKRPMEIAKRYEYKRINTKKKDTNKWRKIYA